MLCDRPLQPDSHRLCVCAGAGTPGTVLAERHNAYPSVLRTPQQHKYAVITIAAAAARPRYPRSRLPSAGSAAEQSGRDDAWALSMDAKHPETHNADPCHAFGLPTCILNWLVVTPFLLFMRKPSRLSFCSTRSPTVWASCYVLHCWRRRAVSSPMRLSLLLSHQCLHSCSHNPCVTSQLLSL